MRAKDLIRLPFGLYNLTDGIYNYSLNKCLTDGENKRPIYSIMEKQSGHHLALFESYENVYEDSSKYKFKTLTGYTSVGGISIHSDNLFWSLNKLKIVPKTNYKEWLSLLDSTKQLTNSNK